MRKKHNSIKNKLKYHFLVHNYNEEVLLELLLKNRRFGVSFDENDYEYVEYYKFSEFEKEIGRHSYPYDIRVYFTSDAPSLQRFREQRARLFPLVLCGNHDCSNYDNCVFSPDGRFNKRYKDRDYTIEYIWRCIAYDEFDYTHDSAEF